MIADLMGGHGSLTGVDVNPTRITACRSLVNKYMVNQYSPFLRLICSDGTTFDTPPTCSVGGESPRCALAVTSGPAETSGNGNLAATIGEKRVYLDCEDAKCTGDNSDDASDSADDDQLGRTDVRQFHGRSGRVSVIGLPMNAKGLAKHRRKQRKQLRKGRHVDSNNGGGPDGTVIAATGLPKPSGSGTYDRVLVDAECTHDGSIKHIAK